jgi:hypothetical protein
MDFSSLLQYPVDTGRGSPPRSRRVTSRRQRLLRAAAVAWLGLTVFYPGLLAWDEWQTQRKIARFDAAAARLQQLEQGCQFGMSKDELLERFGEPTYGASASGSHRTYLMGGPDSWVYSIDGDNVAVTFTFDKQARIVGRGSTGLKLFRDKLFPPGSERRWRLWR